MSVPDKELAKQGPPSVVAAAAGPMVTVEVGPNHERFLIHKALLVHYSEYFAAATRGPWKDTQDGVVPLHDVEPTTFKLFVHWIYNKTVPETESSEEWSTIVDHGVSVDIKGETWVHEWFLVLIKAYVFGDRFLATKFRQEVNQSFSEHLQAWLIRRDILQQVIKYAFSNVSPDRPILQLLVDDHCDNWDEVSDDGIDMQTEGEIPRSFLVRVNRRFAELRDMYPDEGNQPRCYYEHVSDQEKQECGEAHMVYNEKRDYGYFPFED